MPECYSPFTQYFLLKTSIYVLRYSVFSLFDKKCICGPLLKAMKWKCRDYHLFSGLSASFHQYCTSIKTDVKKELWTFRSQDHSLPGAKVPGVELSHPGTFTPTN